MRDESDKPPDKSKANHEGETNVVSMSGQPVDASAIKPVLVEPGAEGAEDDGTFTAREAEIIGANDEALKLRLLALEEDHRDLDEAILALEDQPVRQTLVIARLKKKKLGLKDQITRLRDQVEPDIIA